MNEQPLIDPVLGTVHVVTNVAVLDGFGAFTLRTYAIPCPSLFDLSCELLEAIERLGPVPSLHACGLHMIPPVPDSPEAFDG